jgi:hypothetical protein
MIHPVDWKRVYTEALIFTEGSVVFYLNQYFSSTFPRKKNPKIIVHILRNLCL